MLQEDRYLFSPGARRSQCRLDSQARAGRDRASARRAPGVHRGDQAVSLDDGDPVAGGGGCAGMTLEIFDLLRVPHRVGGFTPTGPGPAEPPTGHHRRRHRSPAGAAGFRLLAVRLGLRLPHLRIPMVAAGPDAEEPGHPRHGPRRLPHHGPLAARDPDRRHGQAAAGGRPGPARPVVRQSSPARSAPRGSNRPRPTRFPPTRDSAPGPRLTAARAHARPQPTT
ncbi:MAG: hypothetical protein R2734_09990 [Nocardioides sp.]